MYDILNSKYKNFDYGQWTRYFRRNDRHRLDIDFSEEPELSQEERELIFPSIASFQKGERSEGEYLQKAARRFAGEQGEGDYPEAIQWFIREENRHSSYLARYMNWHREPKRKKNYLDDLFRRLRQIRGISSEVTVLVTAEIIALSYYTALGNGVESKALRSICRQMLRDELPHVVFQSYTLSHYKNSSCHTALRIVLMEITCLVVWFSYRKVFVAGGYSLSKLLAESLGYLRQSILLSHRGDPQN